MSAITIEVPAPVIHAAEGGIRDKGQAYQALSEVFKAHKSITMSNTLLRASEGDDDAMSYFQRLMDSPFFAAARSNTNRPVGHSKSQDVTADLIELSNIVIDTPVPEAVGEMLARRVDMMQATKKIRIREPAKVGKTSRGKPSRGRGTKSSYITLYPEDEWESHSSWDQKFLEDVEWSVAGEETQAIAEELRRTTSQNIINAIDDIPAADTSIGALHACGTANQIGFDDLVDMRQLMLSKYVSPDRLIINPLQMGDLLKQDVFQDSLKYGDFVNKGMGYIGNFFGMDIYESAQQPDGHVSLLAHMNCMLFAVRRYMMAESYEEVQDGNKEYGVKISTRYQLKTGSPKYALRTENA